MLLCSSIVLIGNDAIIYVWIRTYSYDQSIVSVHSALNQSVVFFGYLKSYKIQNLQNHIFIRLLGRTSTKDNSKYEWPFSSVNDDIENFWPNIKQLSSSSQSTLKLIKYC